MLGASGAGKSTLGRALAAHGFHHLELDRRPARNDARIADLAVALNAPGRSARIGPLVKAIEAMAAHRAGRGTVVTFSCKAILHAPHRASIARTGIDLVVLHGSGAECMDGFVRRERALGRALGPAHWIENDAHAYAVSSVPESRRTRSRFPRRRLRRGRGAGRGRRRASRRTRPGVARAGGPVGCHNLRGAA